MTTRSWRDVFPVHPAADIFPTLGPDELRELGEDIKRNGLQQDVTVWADDGAEQRYLLDGRNRLDAMELVGLDTTSDNGDITPSWRVSHRVSETTDPWEYVLSVNLHRRHLTAEQRRTVIAELLKTRPERSNRQTAKLVGADHKTAASVRRELEGRGEIPHVETITDTRGRSQPTRQPERVPEIGVPSSPKPKPKAQKPTMPAMPPGEVNRDLVLVTQALLALSPVNPENLDDVARCRVARELREHADRIDAPDRNPQVLFDAPARKPEGV